MFKFVIFAALLAFAAAEPGLIGAPVVSTYSGLPAAYGYAAPAHYAYSAPAIGYTKYVAPAAYGYGYSPYAAAPLPYAARSIHY